MFLRWAWKFVMLDAQRQEPFFVVNLKSQIDASKFFVGLILKSDTRLRNSDRIWLFQWSKFVIGDRSFLVWHFITIPKFGTLWKRGPKGPEGPDRSWSHILGLVWKWIVYSTSNMFHFKILKGIFFNTFRAFQVKSTDK